MSNTATYAIRMTLDGAGAVTRAVRDVFGAISAGGRGLMAANSQLFYFGNNIAGLFRGAANLGRRGISLVDAIVGPNERFESAQLQFQQLLGSADAANARIRELYAYGNATPFENPDVLKAGRLLQQFGGEALGAGRSVSMVGDMAAYAQTEMADVAFWVARAYSAIQAGRPWGEAAMRLMEMGLMTDAERTKLEQLAEAGAKGSDVWAAFEASQQKASGAASRLGESMMGVKSTLRGMAEEFKRLIGEGLFKLWKDDLTKFRDGLQAAFDDGRIEKWAGTASKAIAEIYTGMKDKSIFGLTADDLFNATEKGKLVETLSVAVQTSAKNFGIMLRNAAVEYGPQIAESIFGSTPRMRSFFGFEKRDALKSVRAGDWNDETLGKLGFTGNVGMVGAVTQGSWISAFANYMAGGVAGSAVAGSYGMPKGLITDPNTLDERARTWAENQLGSPGPIRIPMVDVRDAIRGTPSIADVITEARAPAVATARKGSLDSESLASIDRILASLSRMADASAEAADSHDRLASSSEMLLRRTDEAGARF